MITKTTFLYENLRLKRVALFLNEKKMQLTILTYYV